MIHEYSLAHPSIHIKCTKLIFGLKALLGHRSPQGLFMLPRPLIAESEYPILPTLLNACGVLVLRSLQPTSLTINGYTCK